MVAFGVDLTEVLEGKFATASFSTSSTRTADGGAQGPTSHPAVVVGGWDTDQSPEKTLRLVKQHLSELRCDLDLEDVLVPGIRRGFAIVPIAPRTWNQRQTSIEEYEKLSKPSVRQNSSRGPVHKEGTDTCGQLRVRARNGDAELNLRGKVKRLILEASGDLRQLGVDWQRIVCQNQDRHCPT